MNKIIEYRVLPENEYPLQIKEQIIPEYRALERALVCRIENSYFIFVSRGEKPSSNYSVEVDEIKMEDSEDGNTLNVYATFDDPKPGQVVLRELTYPIQVMEVKMDDVPFPNSITLTPKFK